MMAIKILLVAVFVLPIIALSILFVAGACCMMRADAEQRRRA